MQTTLFKYPVLILEQHLDMLGHMNHVTYLTLLEEARWDLLTRNGYGLEKIKEIGSCPTVLALSIQYLKEIRLREKIIIETQLSSIKNKVGYITQVMRRNDDICATAELSFGIFDLEKRKLIVPTPEWLKAVGVIE